jgi:transposase
MVKKRAKPGRKAGDYDHRWIRKRYWDSKDPWGVEQIADHYGVSPATILRVMEKHDIPRRPRGASGERHRSAKLKREHVFVIKEFIEMGASMGDISRALKSEFNIEVSRQAIHQIKMGQTWSTVVA